MGGAKKKTLAQMERQQQLQAQRAEAAKKGKPKTAVVEKKPRGIDMPGLDDSRLLSELSKMGAITPYALASQYNLRLSVAKDVLEELERRRIIRPVGGNSRIRIYRIAAA